MSNFWRNFNITVSYHCLNVIFKIFCITSESTLPRPYLTDAPGAHLYFFPSFAPVLSSTLLSSFAPLHERLINCILDLFCFFTPLSPFHLLSSLHPNPSWGLDWYHSVKKKTSRWSSIHATIHPRKIKYSLRRYSGLWGYDEV